MIRIASLLLLIPLLAAGEVAGEARTFVVAGTQGPVLHYRYIAPPAAKPGERLPLLLCLHGAGERGDDNQKQVGHFKPLFSAEAREKFPCAVVIPQVPKDQIWATYGWSTQVQTMAEKPSATLALTKALLDDLLAKEPLDADRVYITGMSMGGYGTWEAIQRWPGFFAAAVPICGGGDVAQATTVAKLPIWAFHGDQDNIIKPESTGRMIEAIIAAGGKPKHTLYPGVGHGSWGKAYAEAELLPWLFGQKRQR